MNSRKTLIVAFLGLGAFVAAVSEWKSSAKTTESSEAHTEQSMVRSKQSHLFKYLGSVNSGLTLPPSSGVRQEPSPEPSPIGVFRKLNDRGSVVPESGNMTYHGGPVQHSQKVFTIF